ncbi:unnamed protein product [Lupinus luteus]|uniref:Uncharacterized protein n=1 Tax=Lupinus luteus TaxID=3873 RepID=A0AAV1WJF9_LUPLU
MNGKTISKTVKNPKSFGIHGLWPSNSEQTSKEPFPKDGFKSLCPQTLQMEIPIYWPNMIEDNNAKLWSIEWNKHGRCSGFDICTYFWNTLGLFKTLRAINLVGKPVVVGNSYDLSTLSAAFKETLGGGKNDILIRCAKIGEKYYLWEVHVYLDAKLTRVQPPEVARVILDKTQVTPCHASAHGSPPTRFYPRRGGEPRAMYRLLIAATITISHIKRD